MDAAIGLCRQRPLAIGSMLAVMALIYLTASSLIFVYD
jgi:hypothetical protein